MSKIRIATAQSNICRDVQQNGDEICNLLTQASDCGAGLIHFPEGALSGYIQTQINHWDDVDWKELDIQLQKIAKAAQEKNIWVVVGSNYPTSAGLPHNSLFVISKSGTIVHRYDKRICSHTEMSGWYTPGTSPCMFDIQGFKFGLVLCIEIHFTEIFQEYERNGIDCILFSSYSKDPMFWTQAQGYAAGNNTWFSVSTPAMCSKELPGGVIGPDGSLLVRHTPSHHSDIVITDLDKSDPQFATALTKAKPWRKKIRSNL